MRERSSWAGSAELRSGLCEISLTSRRHETAAGTRVERERVVLELGDERLQLGRHDVEPRVSDTPRLRELAAQQGGEVDVAASVSFGGCAT